MEDHAETQLVPLGFAREHLERAEAIASRLSAVESYLHQDTITQGTVVPASLVHLLHTMVTFHAIPLKVGLVAYSAS